MLTAIVILLLVIGYIMMIGYFSQKIDRGVRGTKDDGFVEGFMIGSMYKDDGDKFF